MSEACEGENLPQWSWLETRFTAFCSSTIQKKTTLHHHKFIREHRIKVNDCILGMYQVFKYKFWLRAIIMSRTRFRVNLQSYSCLNVKELLVWNRRDIWILSDSNGIWTYNHLVCKRTLNHLAKQTKWLSGVVSTYLYRVFDCMQLLFYVGVSEWI